MQTKLKYNKKATLINTDNTRAAAHGKKVQTGLWFKNRNQEGIVAQCKGIHSGFEVPT